MHTLLYSVLLCTLAVALAVPTDSGIVHPFHSAGKAEALSHATGSTDSSTSTTTNLVSWQSAFLGLVPLALNAMTQPSILDRTFPQSALLFPTRSSPFICVADAVDVLIDVILHLFDRKGIRESASLVLRRRARLRLGVVVTIEENQIEQHPKTYAILQTGVVLQAIKLLACGGIIWTKVVAIMYLSSFLIMWLLGNICTSDWREPSSRQDGQQAFTRDQAISRLVTRYLLSVGISTHVIMWQWMLYQLFNFQNTDSPLRNTARFAGIYLALGVIMFIILIPAFSIIGLIIRSALTTNRRRPSFSGVVDGLEELEKWWTALGLAGWVFWTISFGTNLGQLIYLKMEVDTLLLAGDIVLCGTAVLLSAICFIWIVVSVGLNLMGRVTPEGHSWNTLRYHVYSILFASSNFFLAFLYYRFRYSSEGTEKPGWTENLG